MFCLVTRISYGRWKKEEQDSDQGRGDSEEDGRVTKWAIRVVLWKINFFLCSSFGTTFSLRTTPRLQGSGCDWSSGSQFGTQELDSRAARAARQEEDMAGHLVGGAADGWRRREEEERDLKMVDSLSPSFSVGIRFKNVCFFVSFPSSLARFGTVAC